MFSLSLFGCSCDGSPPTQEADPKPVFEPQTLAYEGLCTGGSDRQTLRIRNESGGRLSGTVTIEGSAAGSFRVELDGETVETVTLGGHGHVDLDIVYEPSGAPGDQEAWLVLTSNSNERPELRALLTGFLSDNPLAPRFAAHWSVCEPLDDPPSCPGEPREPCCWGSPDVVHLGKVGVLQDMATILQMENTGCHAVEITEIEIGQDAGSLPCALEDLVVEAEGGMELPGTVTRATNSLLVQFRPSDSCVLDREIVVRTTDPQKSTMTFRVRGEGVAGSLEVRSPISAPPVNFGPVRKGQHHDIPVVLHNTGSESVQVVGVSLEGPDSGHFEVLRMEQCGEVGVTNPVVASVFDRGEGIRDCDRELTVWARYEPKSPGRHGIGSGYARIVLEQDDDVPSFVGLVGESQPKLQTYPGNRIAFASPQLTACGGGYDCGTCINSLAQSCADDTGCPDGYRCLDSICTSEGNAMGQSEPQAMCATTCETSFRTFRVCNEDGYNDLELDFALVGTDGTPGGPVDQAFESATYGLPIFTLDRGSCGDLLEPEQCCEGRIDFMDNYGGGLNNALLEIRTNLDPEVDGKRMPTKIVDLFKHTLPVERPQVADLETPPSPRLRDPNGIPFRAIASTEYGEITRYEWRFESGPGAHGFPVGDIDPESPDRGCRTDSGRCFALLDDMNQPCDPSGSNCTTLRIYPEVEGVYQVSVRVHGSVCGPPLWTHRDGSVDVAP